jgi:PleD family two-component response regulator
MLSQHASRVSYRYWFKPQGKDSIKIDQSSILSASFSLDEMSSRRLSARKLIEENMGRSSAPVEGIVVIVIDTDEAARAIDRALAETGAATFVAHDDESC